MTDIKVSEDLAQILLDAGVAKLGRTKRSMLPEMLTEGASGVATVISLLQGPMTVSQIVQWLRTWRSKRRPTEDILEIRSSKGSLRIMLNSDTDLEKAAPVIKDLLFPQEPESQEKSKIEI